MNKKIEFSWIGQAHVVRYFIALIGAILAGRKPILRPVVFTGCPGLGKSFFAEYLGEKMLKLCGFVKGLLQNYVVIPSNITYPEFISLWQEQIEGKTVMIFWDECHEIRPKISALLRVLLETNGQEKKVSVLTEQTDLLGKKYIAEEQLTSSPQNHLFIFASNERLKDAALFGPSGRCHELQFLPLNLTETKMMLVAQAKRYAIEMCSTVTEYLAGRVMPNGRAAGDMLSTLSLSTQKVSLDHAKDFVKVEGYFPRGLRRADIVTLQFLGQDSKGKQVQEIAAACGGEEPRAASARLQWLAGMGLIMTHAGKKVLTPSGLKYLIELKQAQEASKANPAKKTTAKA